MDKITNWRKGKKSYTLLSKRKKHKGNIAALNALRKDNAFVDRMNELQTVETGAALLNKNEVNVRGRVIYSLTTDDIELAVPLNTTVNTIENSSSELENNFQVPSTSSPNHIGISSTSLSSAMQLSPIENLSRDTNYTGNEYDNLHTSNSPLKNNVQSIEISGRRIVNMFHLFEEIKNIDDHSQPFDCGFKNMYVIGEKKLGFKSIFTFQCAMCNIKKTVSTENNFCMPINTSAVLGVISIGGGFRQLEEFTCAMEIPTINQKTYKIEHDRICDGFEEAAVKSMYEAAKTKAELAIAAGDVDVDGTPLVTVVADGSWCKRSYKTMYNSPSGMVTIANFHSIVSIVCC
ncbi:hypothetical protein QTP88_015294 [Uroleucon formosanum]